MGDNKNDIDLDKEIESLEGLLNEHDELLDDTFPLDDDFDDELSATPRAQTSKSGAGKYVAYVAFLALLGGGGYAAYKYLPNMLRNDTLMALQSNMNDRTAMVEPQEIIPETSSLALSTNDTMQVVEPMQVNDALPVAMDDNVDDIIVIDTNNNGGFGDIVEQAEPVVLETVDVFEEKPAETIAEALAMTQTAEDEIIVIEEEVESTNIANEVEDFLVDVDGIENNVTTSFERVPAMPILKGQEREEVQSVGVNETVNDESTVVDMAADEVLPVVAVVEDTPIIAEEIVVEVPEKVVSNLEVVDAAIEEIPAAESVIEEMVVETPQVIEPEVNLMEAAVEEMKVPSAPVVEEVVEIEEKVVKPVVVKKSEPKAMVVNNKPLVKVDGRVTQARVAMEQGDFQGALDLYQAVLNNNPSSTSALTGMQLAKAKLRLMGQQVTPQTPSVVTMPVVSDAKNTQGANVSSALTQMSANPRDASLAVKVADLYKAQGNTAKAVEYYRKALQLDVVYKTGLDRMAVYDALSTLQ